MAASKIPDITKSVEPIQEHPGQLTLDSISVVVQSSDNEEIWTTKEVGEKLGITPRQLKGIKADKKFPHQTEKHLITRCAGKDPKSSMNLWAVKKLDYP